MLKKATNFKFGLASLTIFSAISTLWGLAGVARSEYYASIAMSMSKSFSNFFFGAIDPAGTITLDKIPGSYWLPAIFVKLFGFSTWAIIAPNALLTVGTVVLIAITVKNKFGATAGLIAGAIFATTPIVVAVGRSNQPQSLFLFLLALFTFHAIKAIETSSRKSLIFAGISISLAFHAYMLEAWALWPALIIAWLFTQGSLRKRLSDLLLAGSISFVLSLTWVTIVWQTPRTSRPYIGGTYKNNPWEMVFGYNGLGRFSSTSGALGATTESQSFRSFTPPFSGSPGIKRLLQYSLAGQIGWLLPTAFIALALLMWFKADRIYTLFFGMWLVTFCAMFSAVSGMHQFYTSSLAIPISILIAVAINASLISGKRWPIMALVGTSCVIALWIAHRYGSYFSWAPFVQVLLGAIVVILLYSEFRSTTKNLLSFALIGSMLFVPAVWSIDVRNHSNSVNPVAGDDPIVRGMFGSLPPNSAQGGRPPGPPPGSAQGARPGSQARPPAAPTFDRFGEQDNSVLIRYLYAHRNGAKFLLVTFGAQVGASYVTSTGDKVLPIGGFDGSDPTPTLSEFKHLVARGEIRNVLVSTVEQRALNVNRNVSDISAWISTNCSLDSDAPGSVPLYVCGN